MLPRLSPQPFESTGTTALPRRIIPISSGKGGVGKTTIAVNFALALSRVAPTVLVDLDTGTSSVRNTLAAPAERDLYHWHRHATPLAQCVTGLDAKFDPLGRFRNFGFVAGPRHFIHELANPDVAFRRRLQAEINALPAEYVVLDLRAGLDDLVLEFLPYTNSGILVFTPQNPSATLAAGEIVKALLFRSLRVLFGADSPFFRQPGMAKWQPVIAGLLDRVEDVYDGAIPNLDGFLAELRGAFGEHPILFVLADTLDAFRVHYVLNMFDGVEQSYEGAVAPFVKNLAENVSARLNLTQLGWVVYDPKLHEASCAGVPPLLDVARRAPEEPPPPPPDRVMNQLAQLESSFLGIKRAPRRVKPKPPPGAPPSSAWETFGSGDVLEGQLASLRSMYHDRQKDNVRDNFAYVAYRALNLMGPHMGEGEFGMKALLEPERMREWYLRRQLA